MSKGKLIIFTAPSGSGKTTLVRHLLSNNEQLSFSVSATTRKKRDHEEHGRDYYFLSEKEFKSKIAANQFLEWEEVYSGNFYGTLKSEVDRIWEMGKHVIFDVDVRGALSIKTQFPDNSMAVFVRTPSMEELKRRLQKRNTESEETLKRRIDKATYEVTFEDRFDCTLVNDDLQKAKDEALEIVMGFLK